MTVEYFKFLKEPHLITRAKPCFFFLRAENNGQACGGVRRRQHDPSLRRQRPGPMHTSPAHLSFSIVFCNMGIGKPPLATTVRYLHRALVSVATDQTGQLRPRGRRSSVGASMTCRYPLFPAFNDSSCWLVTRPSKARMLRIIPLGSGHK
jgi:hypothetical protein